MSESKIQKKFLDLYYKQGYRIVGKNQHSAVKICRWTKESLRHNRFCFKEKWYGVESHRCLQCTVSLSCLNRCIYCWRTFHPFERGMDIKKIDEPSGIIDELIRTQRLLLTGFKGNIKVDKKKWKEAQNPTNAALSLIGDSILYPKISELLEEFHKRGFSTFLVTKGTSPEKLKTLEVEPTNLYISLCVPDKETYMRVDHPLVKDGWKRMNESLELMKSFSCRTVIRLTLVKGLNMKDPEKYAKLILKAEPDFLEPKGFVRVGESQKRLPMESMPFHEEIVDFARKLSKFTCYEIKDEFKPSRVVLLGK
ncbi:MAG: 4-demethylwyosine synthase TYW1 [Candidatus Aenigmarchaeota archaeon]|nr:4-demethylwyosine synthase TYW1 [Candidatus Aenigmarchaeota archaeon]